MNLHDTIIAGLIIAAFSILGGIVIGTSRKISKEECEARQKSCRAILCNELKHIKDEQQSMKTEMKEIKADIKELLKRIKIS